jgi:hypothetical protein
MRFASQICIVILRAFGVVMVIICLIAGENSSCSVVSLLTAQNAVLQSKKEADGNVSPAHA